MTNMEDLAKELGAAASEAIGQVRRIGSVQALTAVSRVVLKQCEDQGLDPETSTVTVAEMARLLNRIAKDTLRGDAQGAEEGNTDSGRSGMEGLDSEE